ncbi:DUF5906 domain-containing protein [Pseudoscardovia radai]|uniref:DUF5906 domain-containing protein n=1 Tax=Pseudoscardovia radai TaxID=987066 RepID=UPI0039911525
MTIITPTRPAHDDRDTLWMEANGIDRREYQPLIGPATPPSFTHAVRGLHRPIDNPEWGIREEPDFIDRYGLPVRIPRTEDPNHPKKAIPVAPIGYCNAVWDWLNGNIIVDGQGRLYARHRDESGTDTGSDTWDAIASLAYAYGVARNERYDGWDIQLRLEAGRRNVIVGGDAHPYVLQRGIAFRNAVFLRTPTPDGRTRVHMFTPSSDGWAKATACPCRLTVDADYDPNIVREAFAWADWLTADEHSADNLVRFFATPMLEANKEATYVLYGDGGNGKSLTMDTLKQSFPADATPIRVADLLLNNTMGETAALDLMGKLWAWEDEGATLRSKEVDRLKTYSTGGIVRGRRLGNDPVEFRSEATIAICTNNAFTPGLNRANARRFAYVRFSDRTGRDFRPYVDWLRLHGAVGWLMASCSLWAAMGMERPWADVSITNADDISDEDLWVAQCVVRGVAPSRTLRTLYKVEAERKACLERMGLKRGGTTRRYKLPDGEGGVETFVDRPLEVVDEARFAPYRELAMRMVESDEAKTCPQTAGNATQTAEREEPDREPAPKPDGSTVPPDSPAIKGGANAVGGNVHCVPCGGDPTDPKRAIDWQKRARHEGKYANEDTSRPTPTPVRADVMGDGMMCLDLDAPHAPGEPDGWDTIQQAIGAYGTPALPRTYAVRSCRDGIHLYYRLKPGQTGMKGSVDGNAVGVPKVDVKANMGGYVVGAGSHTSLGDYTLADVPPDGEAIPYLSDTAYAFLKAHGYVKGAPPRPPRPPFNPLAFHARPREWHADMTRIPEGQRNQTLHDWAYGRLCHHPGNEAGIKADYYERGRASGLPERELDATWASLMRSLGLA